MIRLAIFDFDGTLADSLPHLFHLINRAAERFRFRSVTDADLEALRGQDVTTVMRRLEVPRWKLPFIARYMRKVSAEFTPDLVPGIASLLRRLRAEDVRIAIVSSNSEANVRKALGPELAALVDRYECGVSLFGKGRRLRKVLRRLRCPAAEGIYIGDELRDGDAAAAAGLPFGAVSWGLNQPDALRASAPAYFFTEVEELAAVLTGEDKTRRSAASEVP